MSRRWTTVAGMVVFLLGACGGGDGIRTGTPEYYMKVARSYYAGGDYPKTNEWLAKATNSTHKEATIQAWPWRLMVLAGQVRAYRDLADNYDEGAKAARSNTGSFFKQINEYRSYGSRLGVNLGQLYDEFEKAHPDGDVQIVFAYPAQGSLALPQLVGKVIQGQMLDAEGVDSLFTQTMQRAVLQEMCDLVDAAGDTAKAQAALKNVPMPMARAKFEIQMARSLSETSGLFGKKKLNDSVKREFLLKLALSALGKAGDEKEAKDLKEKLEKELKEIKK